ncbi:MAG TPA: TonB-dependent receptor [Kiritimatiellia bacterium]|nr:TonB-dependent receptor [Kiritimatiellia bacterium]HRU69560.1 TonB-dependent receptor [Kiritimatiellia bacterium]
MMLSLRLTAASFAACLATTSLTTFSQTAQSPEALPDASSATNALPPIIVQASRTGKTPMQMPASVQVVTAREIAESGCSSTAEVLEKKGGLFIRSVNSNPTLTQLSLRGFGDNSFGRVLILVNGERLNNPDMSSPSLLRIPVSSISRIEIVRGPQTVLHGDFASSGVINIITDDATAEPQTTLGASAGAYDTYSAFANTTGTFGEDGVAYRASADWEKSGGYRDNSDYETYELNAALRKEFGEDRFLSLSAFYHDADYGLPGALSYTRYQNAPRSSDTPQDRSELESFGLCLGGRTTIGADGTFDLTVTASRRETDSRWLTSSSQTFYGSKIDSFALLPQYTLDSRLAGYRSILTLGTDLRYDTTDFSFDYLSPYYTSLLDWEYDRASLAGYAQNEFFFTDDVSLTLGERTEWFDNRVRNADSASSFSTRESAVEASVLYRPSENTKFYAKAGRFYHAPFIDEIFAGVGTPNLALDPETGLNLETGTEMRIAHEWWVALSLYHMRLEDEIYYDPAVYQNRNSPGDTRRMGLDAALRWSRERVGSIALTYSAVRSEFTGGPYDGSRVPLVPAQTISVNGDYDLLPSLALMGGVRHVTRQYLGSDFDNRAEPLKAYTLVDCGVRYKPPFIEGLRVTAGVDNLFGRDYCDYAGWSSYSGAYYYPGRGRFWKVGASFTF